MNIKNFAALKNIFLENRNLKQTIFKNTFWLTLGTGIDSLLRFAFLIYVARTLGATEYGKFTFALAFVSLFVVVHHLGLGPVIIREFSRGEKKEEFYSVISLKILFGLSALMLTLFGSFFITPDPDIQKIILILALFSLINSFVVTCNLFFHAFQRMEYRAWTQIVQGALTAGIGFLVLFKYPSVNNLSYNYLVAAILTLVFSLTLLHFKFLPVKIFWRKEIWKKFLAICWPFALVDLFSSLYGYIDSVIMGYLGMITQTGLYNAALKIFNVSVLPGALISRSFLPVLSRVFKESKEGLQKFWDHQLELMILLAFPLVTGGITLGPKIIGFFYPSDFAPAILAFQILIVSSGMITLGKPFYDVMVASNQQKKIFWLTIFSALINIMLNLILIQKYSLYGAAAASAITYTVIFLAYFVYVVKFTSVTPFKMKFLFTSVAALLSSFLMYLVVREPAIYSLNVFLSVFLGGAVYLISFFGFKNIFKALNLYERS